MRALRLRHDDDDGREVAVPGGFIWEKIFCFWICSDARGIGRGSGSFCGVRDVLIVDEGGVYWRCHGVGLGEEDDDGDLLFNRETVRGPFPVGLSFVVGFSWVGFVG
jgi:hypothetical protein